MATKKKAAAKGPKPASSGKKLLASDPNLTADERAVIQAVKEFETTEKSIALFKQDNGQLMEEYGALLEEREQKRQAADKLVRALDVSYGPWDRYQERTSYNVDALVQLIGKKKFMEIGGTESTAIEYSIDGQKIELAIASKVIPAEIVPDVKTVSPSYHAPK